MQRSKRLWAGGPALMTAAIEATDPGTVLEHSLHIRHPNSFYGFHWGVNGVTLVGDAAHAMRGVSGEQSIA